MDVKTAFLNGELNEVVYVSQPEGFVDPDLPTHVYRLKNTLYGLKQAPRACAFVDTPMNGENEKLDEVDKGNELISTRKVPSEKRHLHAIKRIFRYLKRNLCTWVCGFRRISDFALEDFADADYQVVKDRPAEVRRMPLQSLGDKSYQFVFKDNENSTAISTTEAEYIALSGCCAQILWM
ncbi:retrovirus-related pol polyprotein from transposon TNT 1-94 [Tanacetum coccineum]